MYVLFKKTCWTIRIDKDNDKLLQFYKINNGVLHNNHCEYKINTKSYDKMVVSILC